MQGDRYSPVPSLYAMKKPAFPHIDVPESDNQYILALRERIKELSCLYQIADISTAPGSNIDDILRKVVELIPPSMQYPMSASACILIDGVSYTTAGYTPTDVFISSEIVVSGSERGNIRVCYPNAGSDGRALAFLSEEVQLIKTIAHQVAMVIERKFVEETNAHLQDQLRHADRLATLGQLSAGIAHEINEPLATILGFSQLIASELPEDSELSQDLSKVIDATLHAREVVRKLMLFSRQMPPQKEPLDINKLIGEGLYFLETRCRRQRVTIKRSLADNLPSIVADPGQIHQVLVNLVVNAMQAMPEGGEVSISTANRHGMVEFSVSDTGVGMDDELKQKIFMPFFTTKEIDQGTGLGLSVVHGIVSAHNGRIDVESSPGEGSVFRVFLPAERPTGRSHRNKRSNSHE